MGPLRSYKPRLKTCAGQNSRPAFTCFMSEARAAISGDTQEKRLPACCLSAGTSAIINLLRFSTFVNVRLLDSSLYRRQKRVAARWGVDIA